MPDENDLFQLKRRAQAALDVGRYREAIPLLHNALAIDAENGEILCMLSYACVNLEEYAPALEWANRAVAVNPGEEWGHRLRSVIFMRTDRLKAALEAAMEAARLEPDGTYTLSTLAEAQVCTNRLPEAEDTVQRLLAVAPEDGLAHRTRAYVYLAQKKYAEAETSSRTALKLEPDNSRALRLLGDSLLGQKRLKEAVENFAESLRRNPTNAETRRALQEAAMEYLGWPWGPTLIGVLVCYSLVFAGLDFSYAAALAYLCVWGFAWATCRHGLASLWADNPKFQDLSPATRALVIDACREETAHYAYEVVQKYSLVNVGLFLLYMLVQMLRPK